MVERIPPAAKMPGFRQQFDRMGSDAQETFAHAPRTKYRKTHNPLAFVSSFLRACHRKPCVSVILRYFYGRVTGGTASTTKLNVPPSISTRFRLATRMSIHETAIYGRGTPDRWRAIHSYPDVLLPIGARWRLAERYSVPVLRMRRFR